MKTIVSWSSGKDSAWALHTLRQTPGIEVVGLLTTLDGTRQRVGMHGTRREIVEAQADAVGLPLEVLELPGPSVPNADYEKIMGGFVARAIAQGVEAVAFGDLYLEDIRADRESKLAGTGLTPLFPLWGRDTDALAREMIASGLEARVVAIDLAHVPRALVGTRFDATFLAALPEGTDPCAEKGEFHTVVFGGPMLAKPLDAIVGSVSEEGDYAFADVSLKRA